MLFVLLVSFAVAADVRAEILAASAGWLRRRAPGACGEPPQSPSSLPRGVPPIDPNGQFASDVFSDCAGTDLLCSDQTLSLGRTSCGITSAGTYLIRVYRRSGFPLTCDTFTVEVSD